MCELLYYNTLLMLPFIIAFIFLFTDDIENVYRATNPFTNAFNFQVQLYFLRGNGLSFRFHMCFALSCLLGFTFNYSLVLCMSQNSALTTACIGPVKVVIYLLLVLAKIQCGNSKFTHFSMFLILAIKILSLISWQPDNP